MGTKEAMENTAAMLLQREVIGQTLEEAERQCQENGVISRVTMRDGERRAVTMEYRLDRLNLTVSHGIVTDASIG